MRQASHRQRRDGWAILFFVGCAMALTGLVGLLLVLLATIFPDIQSAPAPHRTPASGPTTVPRPPVHLDKTRLILQQNADCWGAPTGTDCGPGRTYR